MVWNSKKNNFNYYFFQNYENGKCVAIDASLRKCLNLINSHQINPQIFFWKHYLKECTLKSTWSNFQTIWIIINAAILTAQPAIGDRRPGRSVAGGPGDWWPAARAMGGRRPGRWVARGTGEGDGSWGGIPGSAGFAQWNQMRDKYRLIGAYGRWAIPHRCIDPIPSNIQCHAESIKWIMCDWICVAGYSKKCRERERDGG